MSGAGSAPRATSRYGQLIERVFFDRHRKGAREVEFTRSDLKAAAVALGIVLPDNLGDVLYSVRFRTPMPQSIRDTEPAGSEWIVELAGRSRYRFKLSAVSRILPNPNLARIRIPDATPEVIAAYSLDDEQALLAKVRYNRLIDIFLGLTTYSLQNHLRTTVKGVGQIEIDELYVGIDRAGCHYLLPVQAKGGSDQISPVQTAQDLKWCAQRFPDLRCRPISAQFVGTERIALFELTMEGEQLRIVDERHYALVPASELSTAEISAYR